LSRRARASSRTHDHDRIGLPRTLARAAHIRTASRTSPHSQGSPARGSQRACRSLACIRPVDVRSRPSPPALVASSSRADQSGTLAESSAIDVLVSVDVPVDRFSEGAPDACSTSLFFLCLLRVSAVLFPPFAPISERVRDRSDWFLSSVTARSFIRDGIPFRLISKSFPLTTREARREVHFRTLQPIHPASQRPSSGMGPSRS
jgi:hypothetical protein